MAGRAPLALLLLASASASPGFAASPGVEASTDLRRRGISWSDGKPALEAFAAIPISAGLSLQAGAATLRASPRHGGADLLINGALRYTHQPDAWTLWAEVQGLGFAGASGQNYAQFRANVARGIGPLQLQASADWAPSQSAIGGSNTYLGARATTGIPGTPISLGASIGRSLGSNDGTGRAQRLRPGGNYTDYRFDADYIRGAVAFGASLTTTSINTANSPPGTGDFGTRLILRASVVF
jgi:hypothetical protein